MSKLNFKNLVATVALTGALLVGSLASAHAKETFTVLTYDAMVEYEVLPAVVAKFEETCDCEVKFEHVKQPHILKTFLTTYKKANYDILVGFDINAATEIKNSKKISSLFTDVDYDLSSLNNFVFRHDWTQKVMPMSEGPATVVYNDQKVQYGNPNQFNNIKDWIENDKTTFIFANPEVNDLGKALTRMIALSYPTYEGQVEAWKKIKAKTVTVGTGWSSSYGAFMKGESESAMGYGTSRLYHIMVDGDHQYKNLNFQGGMPYLVDSLAIPKNSKHPELAQKFAKLLLSPFGQYNLFKRNATYPVIAFEKGGLANQEEMDLALSIREYKVLDVRDLPQKNFDSVIRAYKEVFSK